jgi:hypothetical protein
MRLITVKELAERYLHLTKIVRGERRDETAIHPHPNEPLIDQNRPSPCLLSR